MFCQKHTKDGKCGGLLAIDSNRQYYCTRCKQDTSFSPYEGLEDAVNTVVGESKRPLRSREIADKIEETTEQNNRPASVPLRSVLNEKGKFYKQQDGIGRIYYWDKPFELQNLVELAKFFEDKIHTSESYTKERGIDENSAEDELSRLEDSTLIKKIMLDGQETYAKNTTAFLIHIISKNEGLDAKELARLADAEEAYASVKLRELVDAGKIRVEKGPGKGSPLKYYPVKS